MQSVAAERANEALRAVSVLFKHGEIGRANVEIAIRQAARHTTPEQIVLLTGFTLSEVRSIITGQLSL